MSRLYSGLDVVLDALDRRRTAGYDDWRATSDTLERLRAARPAGPVAPVVPAALQVAVRDDISVIQADDLSTPAASPMDDSLSDTAVLLSSPAETDTSLSSLDDPAEMPAKKSPEELPALFGDEDIPAAPARAAGKKTASAPAAGSPGLYEPVTDPAQPKDARLAELRACPKRIPCPECPYGPKPHNHVVFGVGNVNAELMFIGEAPGADEDRQGEPFVGRAGQLLNRIIATMGIDRADIYIANVLKCRPDMPPDQPTGNRKPTQEEMVSCRPCLFEQIDIVQPKVIVALGATAMEGLLDYRGITMRELRGRFHDFKGIPVMATYHPSFLLRPQGAASKRSVWEDMLMVKERLGHTITEKDRSYFLTKG